MVEQVLAGCARLRSGLRAHGKVESQQQTDSPLKHLPSTPDQFPHSKFHLCPPDCDGGTNFLDETVKTAEKKISAEILP